VNPATQLLEDDYYTNTFDVVFEPTTHKISAGAALHFDYVSGLDITAHMQYNLWSVSEQAYAWHKPAWEVGVKGTYHFLEKWEVGASYTFLGGRMALVQNQAVAMNDVHDVNLWASYEALDWLTVFVEGKNLANIQSDTYYGYRSFGINAMAGATFRF
jgi:outer membrane cobalamin receptor